MDARVDIDEVVSQVYRGANLASSWDPALSAILELFDASSACLRITYRGGKRHEFLFAIGRKINRELLRKWELDQGSVDIFPVPPVGEVRTSILAEDYPGHPVVEEMAKYDVAINLTHCFQDIDDHFYSLSIERPKDGKSFSQLEIETVKRIGRHFREATLLSRELLRNNVTGQFQSKALDRLGVATILIDPYGHVNLLNSAASQLLARQEVLRLRRFDQLVAVDRASDRKLQDYLAKIHSGLVPDQDVFAMSLERRDGGRPVGLLVYSARALSASSQREENCALIFVRECGTQCAIDAPLIQKLFSFTPAEANLAIGLASGQRLEEIEGRLNIRHNTARAHLRSMFLKAEVSRQAELVALLANSVLPLGRTVTMIH